MLFRRVWNMAEVMMSIGISSMSGSWSVDLIGLVIFHYVWWRWEDAADRVVSWFGWKSGSKNQRNVALASSGIRWGIPDFAISKYLSHAVPTASTLVAGKQNFIVQLDPISSDSPCLLVVPNFCFARQRERGELHRKVFWFEPGMVEF